jgi:uncharacterized protein
MKVILDTNVLVSGIFFKGPPYEILLEWKKNKFKLVTSHGILEEYSEVIDELSLQFPQVNVKEILEKVTLNGYLTFSVALSEPICDDPDDDKFFAAAIASKCTIIVSGDKHLLHRTGYSGINVIKPAAFLNKYLKKQ